MEHSDYTILPEERLNKIYEELNRHHVVKVEELAQLYGTSSMTIRRDLAELERRGLVVRSRGGAVLKTATLVDYNVHIRQGKNVA
ncbi:MAG: DeoR family transcriptional regulator, partial [Firmicutes bacterium]|nr:DeoR family transcriptional regulator [Bacillota bacterium]